MFNKKDYKKIPELMRRNSLFDLQGKTAVIIGGAGKMGRQFAETLSLAGSRVVIADLDDKSCQNTEGEIAERYGSEIRGIKCDVTIEKDIHDLFQEAREIFGRVDIMVFNVMSKPRGYYRPLDEYPLETWKKVLDGNLTGAFLCCLEASKYMKKNNTGSIILTSSVYGVVGPDQRIYEGSTSKGNIYGGKDPLNCPASYSASKAGLIGLAKYFATKLGEFNIRVNVLVPGGVYDGQEESFHKEYVRRTPLRRMAVWSDFNGGILFLASDASRYMTGATLVIDGGWTSW